MVKVEKRGKARGGGANWHCQQGVGRPLLAVKE